jgi:hypothetical protein
MEEYFVIVFRSRTQVIHFKNLLRDIGVETNIYSTPRAVHVGCGLSLKLERKDIIKAKELIRVHKPQSFVGIYGVKADGRSEHIMSVL